MKTSINQNTALNYHIREARVDEVQSILDLFAEEVKAGRMLPRLFEEVQEHIDDWRVAVEGETVVGCVSLEFFNNELCEVRSLAVASGYRRNGLGSALVSSALDLAKERKMARVLTLTRSTRLFEQLGFQYDRVHNYPEKAWTDCRSCPLRHQCDEVAMMYYLKKS